MNDVVVKKIKAGQLLSLEEVGEAIKAMKKGDVKEEEVLLVLPVVAGG